jgi:hypothetical protein
LKSNVGLDELDQQLREWNLILSERRHRRQHGKDASNPEHSQRS